MCSELVEQVGAGCGGRGRDRVGVLEDESLEWGEDAFGLTPAVQAAQLLLGDARCSADRRGEVQSPRAADERRRTHLGQQLEVQGDGASCEHARLHADHAKKHLRAAAQDAPCRGDAQEALSHPQRDPRPPHAGMLCRW